MIVIYKGNKGNRRTFAQTEIQETRRVIMFLHHSARSCKRLDKTKIKTKKIKKRKKENKKKRKKKKVKGAREFFKKEL